MNDTTTLPSKPVDKIDELTERAACKADAVIDAAQRVANETLDSLHGTVDTLRHTMPDHLHRAAAQVDELSRRGKESASRAGTELRHKVAYASDCTVGYIREEPVKAMLMAAAAGAALALLIGSMSHASAPDHHDHR